MTRLSRTVVSVAFALCAAALLPPASRAFDFFDGRLQIHGYTEIQLRALAADYHPDNADLSMWSNVLNLEVESDLAPKGFGPFDTISTYTRLLVRYDCIYTGCGVLPTWRYYGDRANRVPPNLAGGRLNPYTGQLPYPIPHHERFQQDSELLNVYQTPLTQPLLELGAPFPSLVETLDPIDDALFSVKSFDTSKGNGTFTLGPWNPNAKIDPSGSLDEVTDPTSALPLRPAVPAGRHGGLDPHGLFVPSQRYLDHLDHYDGIEQNYSETDLAMQHVQSQDERELKEAYVDATAFEGRLWMRLGKQNIVWGKTELFRTTDQFNPQTVALSSLPSLEESRIALWSARASWSFYDVGPLEDVRLEVAANLDDYEPTDIGRCGTPYTVWLVCGKTFGYWAHGAAGIGVAGEPHPPSWWDSAKGLEFGARVEFRYDRFSFQISDFWGYDDFPTLDTFNTYERKVNPDTGEPLDIHGNRLLGQSAEAILRLHPANRQFYDVGCSATKGIVASLSAALADECLLNLTNSQADLAAGITPAMATSRILGGSAFGKSLVTTITGLAGNPVSAPLVELNRDPNDGPGAPGLQPNTSLSAYLTDAQEALLGCGPFYGTNCDVEGLDLFNTEASVILQALPQFERNGPVATRYVPGQGAVILPGARGPGDPRYTPYLDGCVGPGPTGCNAGDPGRTGAAAHPLVDPRTGQLFRSEMAALSFNFLNFLAAVGSATGTDPACDLNDPLTCNFVRSFFNTTGLQRPEVRAAGNGEFGRRDFIWAGGSEVQLRYDKRNVLGFAADFAEDHTKSNWSFEATWIPGQAYAITSEPRGWGERDTWNLTVSVDRPTFINFLNPNRTFFLNSQVFFRYIQDYVGDDRMTVHGPLSALWTLTATTGYFQDRLLPQVTWVHDALSNSGGLIAQLTYRFTDSFSATVGANAFYGKPDELQVPLAPLALQNQGPSYKADTRYDGLSAIAERDELFLTIRYTF